ncbi:BadF/BadG/BcrA/BcrD ATPase family protein [Alteriqipengyuania lutimaris]|uniref:ATPase n=1 Tax=Alteriqipengyuania lutimaris TaxID=1538146 RepID=A0A395LHL5_9SPHN|nr:BadF/BadG/BcrA/BcrD ATPase family protein [Alteriqipengyuania lutimaris]MBB3035424.1 glucosamine kinase [Alteriqipengyuania lutimaris]RDS76141.1 ATPase [Alteriqipengyuania lutimaris]
MARYYLGFDVGGSRTRARLINADGAVIGTGEAGPGNTRMGIGRVKKVLLEAGSDAIAAAGIEDGAIGEIAMGAGIAGLSRDGACSALEAEDFPYASTLFATDGMIANLGAHGGQDGAILIIGTGSSAHVLHEGKSFTIGGYGFPISDEGSGAALGLSAMRHALRALDGRTKPTPLSSAITARFGHETPRAIAWMDEARPADYASFAPLVMDFAEANDEIARSIVEDGARHIERFIETIFERGAIRCALAGGLAPRMEPWLKARTVARLVPAHGDPVDGALYLAGYRPQP